MPNDKLKQQIAAEAARLMQSGEVNTYHEAKIRAARSLRQNWVRDENLPDHRDIRDALHDRMKCQPDASPHTRFDRYRMLLLAIEGLKLSAKDHAETDALVHSLQVFEMAQNELPYDEEFQLAGLLHEVGRGIDPHNPVAASLESLTGYITERTAWFIEHLASAAALHDGTLGVRSRHRLEANKDYEELMLLEQCDRRGRERGLAAGSVEDALGAIQTLSEECGE